MIYFQTATKAPDLGLSINNIEILERHLGIAKQQELQFVELLWDNFAHLTEEEIASLAQQIERPIALHVMWSRFLERPLNDLKRLLSRLRSHVAILDPVYISDHICCFSNGERFAQTPFEYDYDQRHRAEQRIQLFQESIGRQMLIENFASTDASGSGQSAFFREISAQTGCGILFDISNACVAELNGILAAEKWIENLDQNGTHCHIGSYAFSSDHQLYMDTHDRRLSNFSRTLTQKLANMNYITSLCLERDKEVVDEEICDDLSVLNRSFATGCVS